MNETEICLYDLAHRPATFDFAVFLALSKTLGSKHVRFVYGKWKKKNYSLDSAQERFDSILKPLCQLYDMPYSIGEPVGIAYNHFQGALIEVCKQIGHIEKIKYPCVPHDYVTITLRKSRYPARDSNVKEWEKFAEHCDSRCIFIKDYDEEKIPLLERMDLYANAKMNFFVPNGPVMLCVLSEAPYIEMRTIGDETAANNNPAFMKKIGITEGFQYPWANPRQYLSYRKEAWRDILEEYNLSMELERIAA